MATADLSSPSARLKWARLEAGYSSARSAAEAFGWVRATYQSHEDASRTKRGLPEDVAKRYGRAFGVQPSWLMTGEGTPRRRPASPHNIHVHVAGGIGAGNLVEPTGDDPGWYRELPSPIDDIDNYEVFEVAGRSMLPYFASPDLIFVERKFRNPAEMIGRICLVRLETGERMIKILMRGSQPGTFDLHSPNAEPIPDKKVMSVGRIALVISQS